LALVCKCWCSLSGEENTAHVSLSVILFSHTRGLGRLEWALIWVTYKESVRVCIRCCNVDDVFITLWVVEIRAVSIAGNSPTA
jgi:hypothetical protein